MDIPPPGMHYKVECRKGVIYYLGKCTDDKARSFCKSHKAINLLKWMSKGWKVLELTVIPAELK